MRRLMHGMSLAWNREVLAHLYTVLSLQADICQLGLDQRKVNVLAREYCDQCKPKRKLKPVILSHEMMPGLLQVRHRSRHEILYLGFSV